MKRREIFITQFDKDRLVELMNGNGASGPLTREDLRDLQQELNRAQIVDPKSVPASVVTMNSKVRLRDQDTAEEMTYTLVFPQEADIDSGAISVLAPIGTAILGYREGDVIEWAVPVGKRRIAIEKVLYQPEAAGHFNR